MSQNQALLVASVKVHDGQVIEVVPPCEAGSTAPFQICVERQADAMPMQVYIDAGDSPEEARASLDAYLNILSRAGFQSHISDNNLVDLARDDVRLKVGVVRVR